MFGRDENWQEGGSKNGYGGMKHFEARDRRIERRTIEHPDGRREIVETIVEGDVRSLWFSAKNPLEYKFASNVFRDLALPAARNNTPMHQLQSMKNDIIRELQHQQTAAVIPYKQNIK